MDMTYQEIGDIKSNIQSFLDRIRSEASKHQYIIEQCDNDLFIFLAKHALFFKYMSNNQYPLYPYKVLISDFLFFIVSIIQKQERYMYLNERSIIENYLRAIMEETVESNHITENVFEKFKLKFSGGLLSQDNYSLIRSEYVISCNYVHGGEKLNDSLAIYLENCLNDKKISAKYNKATYYTRLIDMIRIFDRIMIANRAEYVSGCFHRKKSVLKYLMGNQTTELLFCNLKV